MAWFWIFPNFNLLSPYFSFNNNLVWHLRILKLLFFWCIFFGKKMFGFGDFLFFTMKIVVIIAPLKILFYFFLFLLFYLLYYLLQSINHLSLLFHALPISFLSLSLSLSISLYLSLYLSLSTSLPLFLSLPLPLSLLPLLIRMNPSSLFLSSI